MARSLCWRVARFAARACRCLWPAVCFAGFASISACTFQESDSGSPLVPTPSEIIDLGALVTEDLPERVWGSALLEQRGCRSNSFEVIPHAYDAGSNAYYELFNHGGPHVDAPNHVGFNGGVDSFPIEAFAGPVRVFDARGYPNGPSVPIDVFQGQVAADDIVLIVTGFSGPSAGQVFPEFPTLTDEAAEFLATLPIRAFGTDGFSVGYVGDSSTRGGHYSFLSRGIPVYEQLFNVEVLLEKQNMFFVGVPLNIEDGDGMIVRPVVFVY